MTFGEHLEELRTCLFKAILGLVGGFLVGLGLSSYVVNFIQTPLEEARQEYDEKQAAKKAKEKADELRKAGYALPGDPDEIAAVVAEKGWRFEEVYINPRELLQVLEQAGSNPTVKLPEHAGSPGPEPNPDKGSQDFFDKGPVRIFLWRPIEPTRAISLAPHEPFLIYIKAAFLVGLMLASPWIFYQIWMFVAAGLYPHERQFVHVFLPFSILLFLLGGATAFFFVFEPVLRFLFTFNDWLGIDPEVRITDWLGFAMMLPLGFGISFQLPLVMLFLERIGVFDVHAYLSKWRVAILVIFVLAMFLTPADPQSMLLMAVPLTALYFGGILLCRLLPRAESPFDEPED